MIGEFRFNTTDAHSGAAQVTSRRAILRGSFAIHRCVDVHPNEANGWAVTIADTGIRVARFDKLSHAAACARELERQGEWSGLRSAADRPKEWGFIVSAIISAFGGKLGPVEIDRNGFVQW